MNGKDINDNVLEELEKVRQMKMNKFQSKQSQMKDVLEEANDLEIAYGDDDMISEMSLQIPVLNTTAAMKFVEKEAQKEDLQNESYLRASMAKIDKSLDIQIFNAPTSDPIDQLDITVQK